MPVPTNAALIQLSDDDREILKRVVRREQDATHTYQVIEMRARADLMEATRAKTDAVRMLADKYGFDDSGQWSFDDAAGTLTPKV